MGRSSPSRIRERGFGKEAMTYSLQLVLHTGDLRTVHRVQRVNQTRNVQMPLCLDNRESSPIDTVVRKGHTLVQRRDALLLRMDNTSIRVAPQMRGVRDDEHRYASLQNRLVQHEGGREGPPAHDDEVRVGNHLTPSRRGHVSRVGKRRQGGSTAIVGHRPRRDEDSSFLCGDWWKVSCHGFRVRIERKRDHHRRLVGGQSPRFVEQGAQSAVEHDHLVPWFADGVRARVQDLPERRLVHDGKHGSGRLRQPVQLRTQVDTVLPFLVTRIVFGQSVPVDRNVVGRVLRLRLVILTECSARDVVHVCLKHKSSSRLDEGGGIVLCIPNACPDNLL